jgi:Flp pilus assembly protein TadD
VSIAVRALAVVIALVVCAWFAVGVRQAQETDHATSIIANPAPLTAAQAAHATSLLNSATFLNPDQEVAVLKADVLSRLGEKQRAVALLEKVVHEEPQNIDAWQGIARNATDSHTYFLAFIEIGRLMKRLVKPKPHR